MWDSGCGSSGCGVVGMVVVGMVVVGMVVVGMAVSVCGSKYRGGLPVLVSHLHSDDWNDYLNEDDLLEVTDAPE